MILTKRPSQAIDYKVVYGGTQDDGVLDMTSSEMVAHSTCVHEGVEPEGEGEVWR